MSMESSWMKYLRALPPEKMNTGGLLGDDAALIDVASVDNMLVTVDMLTEGVDFLLAEADPLLVGRKALAVNLSDIAAMAGVPRWVFVAVALPTKDLELPKQLLAGMQPLMEKYNLVLAGGDTNTWHGGLVISITVIGTATSFGVFHRSGCQAGDKILVTGKLGGSILEHQFLFEPRIAEALYLNEHSRIHAAMDISDGLTLDLQRMLTESGQQGATLFAEQIPVSSDAVKLHQRDGISSLQHALSDGEDFELLLSVAPEEAQRLIVQQPLLQDYAVTLYEIGEVTPDMGLQLKYSDGHAERIEPAGYEH